MGNSKKKAQRYQKTMLRNPADINTGGKWYKYRWKVTNWFGKEPKIEDFN